MPAQTTRPLVQFRADADVKQRADALAEILRDAPTPWSSQAGQVSASLVLRVAIYRGLESIEAEVAAARGAEADARE